MSRNKAKIFRFNYRKYLKVLTHRLQHPKKILVNIFFVLIIPSIRTSKIQNGHQGARKRSTGLERGVPRFLGTPVSFC